MISSQSEAENTMEITVAGKQTGGKWEKKRQKENHRSLYYGRVHVSWAGTGFESVG